MDIDTTFNNMEMWYENIKFAIHFSQDCEHRELLEIINQADPTNPVVIDHTRNSVQSGDFFSATSKVKLPDSFIKRQQKSREFCGALDTVIDLISTLKSFKPDRILDTQAPEPTLRNYKKVHAINSRYCDLCWRLTLQSIERIIASETNTNFRIGLNDQYCCYHDPIENSSQYKADLPYREVFQQEIAALNGSSASNFEFQFPLEAFSKGYEMDARKTAFDLVHAKLRPIKGKDKLKIGLKEKVFGLRNRGLNFEEIATALNTKKYSAKRAWASLESLFVTHQNEQFISRTTGEVIDQFLSEQQIAVLSQVNELLSKNISINTIAKETGFFNYTIKAIQIRIKDINATIQEIDNQKIQFMKYPNTQGILEKLAQTKLDLLDFYQTGTNIILIKKVQRDLRELEQKRKEISELFISKLVESANQILSAQMGVAP